MYLDLVLDLSEETMNHIMKIAKGVLIRKIASDLSPPMHLNLRFGTQGLLKNAQPRTELSVCFNLNEQNF